MYFLLFLCLSVHCICQMCQLTWLLFDDVCRKMRNEPGESMVCWRDNAAFGFETLFWRNHGNEIFRRLFWDLVGAKPSGCCFLSLPLILSDRMNNGERYTINRAAEHGRKLRAFFPLSFSTRTAAVFYFVHFFNTSFRWFYITIDSP